MDSNAFSWVLMGPNWSLKVLIRPYEFQWVYLGRNKSLCVLVNPYGVHIIPFAPYGF